MSSSTDSDVDVAIADVAAAASDHARTTPSQRAALLCAVAEQLESASNELVELAGVETHLPAGRLRGELARTTYQLRLFAELVVDGSCFDAVIQHTDAHTPLGPRPDLRRVSQPLGPVLVFAASNFPFAFSVAGGDTASALAAGCPVVVKAHPGHPRLSDRVAQLMTEAGAPIRVLHGREAGRVALSDPRIRAGAFTGSTQGGRALFDIAMSRPDPIPFYGELGSVNPAFASPEAVKVRGPRIANGYVQSFTLGVGQFCTKPGLLFLPEGHGLEAALIESTRAVPQAPMLGTWIRERYDEILRDRRAVSGIRILHDGEGTAPVLMATTVADLRAAPTLLTEECFGPTSIVVEYRAGTADLLEMAASMEGQLTATVHAEPNEGAWAESLLNVLRTRAGRIIHNGWPTGVAVDVAMHHGGPWPSTTSPLHGSVAGNSIGRFLAPTCYQDVPDALLPPELQDANPLDIRRRVNGQVQ